MPSSRSTSAPKQANGAVQRKVEPLVLLAACLLTAASLYISTTAGNETYAGFPFHFVTIYNFAITNRPGDFWSRLVPQWNVNGMLYINLAFYYIVIVILRAVFIKLAGRH